MLTLCLILLVATLALALFLYLGSLFLQGYYYTEPSETLFWGAPAAGFALGGFLFLWCLLIVNTPGASPSKIPYDTILNFSPRVDVLPEPAKELFAVKKNGEEVHYKRFRVPSVGMVEPRSEYRTAQDTPAPWRGQGVEKIVIVIDSEKQEFKLAKPPPGDTYPYRQFVNDRGWVVKEMADGPTGQPEAYRWGRFFAVLLLNLLHFAIWFGALWALLRFQWSHALGLAFFLWLGFTIAVLPMLLNYAATVAGRTPGVG